MATPKLTDSDIRNELRKLVIKARKEFRADMEDTVALIEAQAGLYGEDEKARAPKVIAKIQIKIAAADALYDQLFNFLERDQ